MEQQHTAYLLTGSNLGDPALQLRIAADRISERAGDIVRYSGIYRTEPWGNKDQPAFLNQVLMVSTVLSPEKLMETLLGIESDMGRVRNTKWEPRSIDIDILFYDSLMMRNGLNVPHPLLHERRFTLEPLAEIAPDLIHPVLGLSVKQLLEQCPDKGEVEKI